MDDKEAKEKFGFNLDKLAGDALRKKELSENVSQIDSLFQDGSETLRLDKKLHDILNNNKGDMTASISARPKTEAAVSEVYERFEHAGVEFQSRFLRIDLQPVEGSGSRALKGKMYILAAVADGSEQVGLENCGPGAIILENGETTLFGIREDEGVAFGAELYEVAPEDQFMLSAEIGKALQAEPQQ